MARKLTMSFLFAILVAGVIKSSVAQTTHTVGGTLGWTIPPGGATTYPAWAANQTFAVGDILVFNFLNNQHDVAQVTRADYNACTTTTPISLATTTPARITINATGEHFFICNFTGHCGAGQKLTINVSAATTPSPASQPSSPPPPQSTAPTSPPPASTPPTTATPPTTTTSPPSPTTPSSQSPSGTTAPPPPDSSAKSLGVAGLSATFLSLVLAFLY